VKTVVNQNASRENHCVREEVHPSIVQMGREIVALFGIELGGLDLLTSDIGVPLDESRGVINEVNTTPGLHHHALVAEVSKALPIGEMILEYLYSRTHQRQAVAHAVEQVAQS
jgi:cyanophycin synthetase